METFHQMQRLQKSCQQNGPLCIGLDTSPSYLPENIRKHYSSEAQAVLAYNKALINSCKPYCGCAKVQIAYYEAMGLEGLQVYVETLRELKANGIPVISDIKRGDIADTAKAYAHAHFSGDFETDIITVNPYMGFDTLVPFTEFCGPLDYTESSDKLPKGIFVLLRTSNPGMKDIENLDLADGSRVFDKVGEELLRIHMEFSQKFGYDENEVCSPVGAVVGCTEEENARELRNKYPNVFFLIPGYGAQGGKARIAGCLLDKAGGAVNSSRGILCAWQKDESLAQKKENCVLTLDDIVESARKACEFSKTELLKFKAECADSFCYTVFYRGLS